jgi:hypothetical protein
MNEHEARFVRAFILPEKRERYTRLLSHPKRRGKILERLNHKLDIDYRFATPVPPPQRQARTVERLLRQRGAGLTCHVIADASPLDGQDVPLAEALDALFGQPGFGAVLSCVSGRLAFYKEEDIGEAYVLEALTECPVSG